MSMIVVLDTGPLGMVTNPKATSETGECQQWLKSLLTTGVQVAIPEIADYELRRELIRANKTKGLARLNALKEALDYLPLTTQVMLKAAEFWAAARNQGLPTAADTALDGDVILAAQVALLSKDGHQGVVATTNVRHLELFVEAHKWNEIHN